MFALTKLQIIGGILLVGVLLGGGVGGCVGYKFGHYSGYRQCEKDNGINGGWFEPAPESEQ